MIQFEKENLFMSRHQISKSIESGSVDFNEPMLKNAIIFT
jgi:hypothetical protein